MKLSPRQKKILQIVKEEEPITSHELAERLSLTRSALRPDLTLLTLAQILHAKPRVGYFYNPESSQVFLKQLLLETKIAELQSVPIAVRENTNIYNAAITMFLEDSESLFVVDEDRTVKGYISSKELVKVLLGGGEALQLPVSVAMNKIASLQCLTETASLIEGLHMLNDGGMDAVAVVDEGKLVGRINRDNIINFLLEKIQIKMEL